MRGIETGKVRIRHEVFTEIARMAYEGGDYAKRPLCVNHWLNFIKL